ncbi:MAG: Brp/Blh family beta-carotene 15,15'-dioxygenase [Bacteroidota bacterium]
MQILSFRDDRVQVAVLLVGLLFVTVNCMFPSFMVQAESTIIALLFMLGIPHGATDFALFRAQSEDKRPGLRQIVVFLVWYLGIIGIYSILWLLVPILALAILLLLAVYHFGQSNWSYVYNKSNAWAFSHYAIWGAAVLGAPILLHATEAEPIISAMVGTTVSLPGLSFTYPLLAVMGVVNLGIIAYLLHTRQISGKRATWEVASYLALMAVFLTNSLLLGFTLYFVFWHSLSALLDQAQFLYRRLKGFQSKQLQRLLMLTILFSAIAIGLAWMFINPAKLLNPSLVGGLFIFISLLTLPHMILVDRVYRLSSEPDSHSNTNKTTTSLAR